MSKLIDLRVFMHHEEFERAVQHVDEMLIAEPENPLLWQIRGDIIQLVDSTNGHPLEEAERSYLKVLELRPHNLEVLESLSHYYDAVGDAPIKAKKYATEYLRVTERVATEMKRILREGF